MNRLDELVCPHVRALAPVSPPDRERGAVRLDANESPFNAPRNRYPDAGMAAFRAALSQAAGLRPECIAPAAGTGEAVDMLLRVFCRPGVDRVIGIEPTCGLYARRAAVHGVAYRGVPLGEGFGLSATALLSACDAATRLIFLCSPNNPTGNQLDRDEIERLLAAFDGIVVVDEAYIDYAPAPSVLPLLAGYRNLVVLRTFSKAWALAGVRVAMAYAAPEVVGYLERVRLPHSVAPAGQQAVVEQLRRRFDVDKWVNQTLDERGRLMLAVSELPYCERVYPSQANFFLCRLRQARQICDSLARQGIDVRDCTALPGCDDCLRISVGLPHENNALVSALRNYPFSSSQR